MESGRIEDAHITASSNFDDLSTGPANARIRSSLGGGAWCPLHQINGSSHEWIQVELPSDTLLTAVETQGRWDSGRGAEYVPDYMIEYWRDSLGQWARYRDHQGGEILPGNSDTQSAELRRLDGAIVAKLVRLIPVSESTRTVCLRLELYGCPYKGVLESYAAPEGSEVEGLDMRDFSYDGHMGTLVGGLGRLYDGSTGREGDAGWVGWHRSQHPNGQIAIELSLSTRRNVSAISLHSANHLSHLGPSSFHNAKLYFATTRTSAWSPRVVEFEQEPDSLLDKGRWVRIAISNRMAMRVRIEIHFAHQAEWLLLSEIDIESAVTDGGEGGGEGSDSTADIASDTTITRGEGEGRCRMILLIVPCLFVSASLLTLLLFVMRARRNNAHHHQSKHPSPHKCASTAKLKMLKMTLGEVEGKMQGEGTPSAVLTQSLDFSTYTTTSSEYAEPDVECTTESLALLGSLPYKMQSLHGQHSGCSSCGSNASRYALTPHPPSPPSTSSYTSSGRPPLPVDGPPPAPASLVMGVRNEERQKRACMNTYDLPPPRLMRAAAEIKPQAPKGMDL